MRKKLTFDVLQCMIMDCNLKPSILIFGLVFRIYGIMIEEITQEEISKLYMQMIGECTSQMSEMEMNYFARAYFARLDFEHKNLDDDILQGKKNEFVEWFVSEMHTFNIQPSTFTKKILLENGCLSEKEIDEHFVS